MKSTERHKLKENEFARSMAQARIVVEQRRGDVTRIAVAVIALLPIVGGYAWWRSSGGRREPGAGGRPRCLRDAGGPDSAPSTWQPAAGAAAGHVPDRAGS